MSRPAFPRGGSPGEQLRWRLAFDFRWVCANLITITSKVGNRPVPFVFNAVQLWVYWNVLDQESRGEPVRLWILKGRQFGISTLFCVRQFVLAAFHHANCLILPHKETPGKNMFAKVERALRNLPPLREGDSLVELVEKPTSHILGDQIAWNTPRISALVKRESAENPDAGVSETYQHVHLTEVPLWKDASHTMGGLLPTIPDDAGTTIVGEFTARGEGDYAHGTWVDAEFGDSPFRAIFLPWYWHAEYSRKATPADRGETTEERDYRLAVADAGHVYPLKPGTLKLIPELAEIQVKRDLLVGDLARGFKLSREQMLWRRDRLKEFRGDVDLFNREYPWNPQVAYQSSGRRLIPPALMDKMDSVARKEGEAPADRGEYEVRRGSGGRAKRVYRKREDGRVWRWEAPKPDSFYIVDADPASGTGKDYCGAHVLRVSYQMIDVVASFKGRERPHDFARILARMGQHYRCDAVADAGGRLSGGLPALLVVERNGFGEHVIHELDQNLAYKRLYRHDERGKRDDWKHSHAFGFPIHRGNKLTMLHHLGQVVHDEQLRVRCSRTRGEMRGLVYLDEDDRTAGAGSGAHDDLAMCLGEGVFVASGKAAFRRKPSFGGAPAAPATVMFSRLGR